VARVQLGAGEPAARTPMDLPIAADIIRVMESVRGKTVLIPTSGGTVPMQAMERASGSSTIMVPIANHDDNQHAANENLRMKNLWDGVETMAALMAIE
jgi:acetylornithine deacetylase/succinyl-diaminopimelate desuccinylase-like protein